MVVLVYEMLNFVNLSWCLMIMLIESVVLVISKYVSELLKVIYFEKLVIGEWIGIMNLMELYVGIDLSLLFIKVEFNEDGSFIIIGSKIFIMVGDYDWIDNIIYMVLVRFLDVLLGVKGISLFLVFKFLFDVNGIFDKFNVLGFSVIEKKMGIKVSFICVMNFDGVIGWLIGEVNQGFVCMFIMMNDVCFQVGLEGLGVIEVVFQGVLIYVWECF